MLSSKTYLKVLLSILGLIIASTIGYVMYFAKHYPIPIMDHISFDSKIQFIREHVDVDKIDTVVIGSSLALNNIQGIELEKNANKVDHVLNLSVWSIDAPQVEQLLNLTNIFPNLERIIYSGQFTSFNHASQFKNYNPDFLKKYMNHELNSLEYARFLFDACKDISFCVKRQLSWEKEYGDNHKFSYLNFDYTGSAPLHMYGKDIIQSRWNRVDGATQNPNALKALARMAKKAQEKNIKYYFVQQPYRQEPIDKYKHVRDIMKSFPNEMITILDKYNATFINLHDRLHLDDSHFADRSHLNDKGSKVVSETLAEYINRYEK